MFFVISIELSTTQNGIYFVVGDGKQIGEKGFFVSEFVKSFKCGKTAVADGIEKASIAIPSD